ncbi:efflux RND transporter permease subunit [Dokdonella sp.]|uniref:efflux RND transporter permease subunit n=1 Tax=Dokdonella sp. TaxID=2291710 RepID=UPI0035277420
MARFFIDRPIFAIVISLFLILTGVLSMLGLPIAQYPDIAPPTVAIRASYPGANAIVVNESVSSVIDQQVNGTTDMKYIKAVSGNDGSSSINVTFDLERDADIASVEVQNRVSQVTARLPPEVRDIGVSVTKSSPDTLQYIAIYSPRETFDFLFINNYTFLYVVDSLKRLKGVGDVTVFGSEFGMRVWLKPDRMAALGLTVADISRAVQSQNVQAPAGQIGMAPASSDTGFQYTLSVQGRLVEVEEFENIILRNEPDGSSIRLRDVARVELGAKSYDVSGQLDGSPASILGIFLAPGADALETAELIKHEMVRLKSGFPEDLDYKVVYDTSLFVEASIEEVMHTFVEALVLVLIVVFLFLQSWRATLIPMIAVPVSLIATFIVFQFLGFSINTLSLFGMVLAIGIVVDDAIVVVEAVEHKMHSLHLSPKEATRAAMDEVSGPVMAIALVLSAVFIPMAFVPGVTGQLYKQFALTVAVSTMFSALVALTLTPALCAIMLKPKDDSAQGLVDRFFAAFNRGFDRMTEGYGRVAAAGVRRLARVVVVMVVLLVGISMLARVTPTGFVPDEDTGAFFIHVVLPEASSSERTSQVLDKVQQLVDGQEGVEAVLTINGYDLISGSNASSAGLAVVRLKPWGERKDKALHADAIMKRLGPQLAAIPEAMAFAFNPPALPGFGSVSGFSMMLQARGESTPEELAGTAQAFIAAAMKQPAIGRISTTFQAATPNYKLDVDRDKVEKLGVPLSDVFAALQAYLGSSQINEFSRFGRNYKVTMQADADYRRDISTLSKLFVRSADGRMIPLDTIVTAAESSGPRFLMRYNLYPTAEITGSPAPGFSSGQAIAALEAAAAETLGDTYGYEWSGQTREEIESGSAAAMVMVLSVVVVFLFLAALYESWSIPMAVLLAAPLGALGAFAGILLNGMDFNVYGQIGIVTLIGLAAKNAILIVEFAKLNRESGMSVFDSAVNAAKLRLRPILMTSFAFILGVVPLLLASGAGAASKQSVGTVVFFGMLSATVLSVLLVPALYAMIQGSSERFFGSKVAAASSAPAASGESP